MLLRIRALDRLSHEVECYNGFRSDLARVVPVAQIFIGFQNGAAGDETIPEAGVRSHWYVRMDQGAEERAEFVDRFWVDVVGVGEGIDIFLGRCDLAHRPTQLVSVVRPGPEFTLFRFAQERGVENVAGGLVVFG